MAARSLALGWQQLCILSLRPRGYLETEVNADVIVNIPPNRQPIFFLNGRILVLNKYASDEVLVMHKDLKIQAEVTWGLWAREGR